MKKINESTKVTLTLGQIKRLVKESKQDQDTESFDVIPFEKIEIGDIVCRAGYPNILGAVIKKGLASEVDDQIGSMEEGIREGYVQPDEPCVLVQRFDAGDCNAWVYGDAGVIAMEFMGNVKNYTGKDEGCF